MRILLIALIAYGAFHLGIFLAWLCKRFTINTMLDTISETIGKFLHYYKKGNIFGKILAITIFTTLVTLTLPEIIIGHIYYPIIVAKRDLKDFIERKCYPDLVEQVIYNVPHSKFQPLIDAGVDFGICVDCGAKRDYIIVYGLASYEKAQKVLGKEILC